MYKILLIEDFQVIQEMYQLVLQQNEFEVDTANDGKDALDKVQHKQYDLILLDMLLPEINGVEFLEKFTNRGNTKIIALSDFDYKDTVKKAFDLGVSKYWIKVDFTPYVLAEKVRKFLNGESDEETGAPAEPPVAA